MGIIDNVKALVDVARQIDNIDLYRQMLDLQAQALELVEEHGRLKKEIASLKERLTIKDSLVFQHNCYWLPKDAGRLEGPFCSHCWDTGQQLVRMWEQSDSHWYCRACQSVLKVHGPVRLGPH